MNQSNTALFILLIMLSASSGAAESAEPAEDLKACARMEDRDARLACFDDLAERVLRKESAGKETAREEVTQSEAASTATESLVQPLPEDLGTLTPDSKKPMFKGKVTACKTGTYGDLYFIFDNGQVWKAVGERKPRFKECNFDVTITEDFFGYKMKIDDMDKTVPIKRHQ